MSIKKSTTLLIISLVLLSAYLTVSFPKDRYIIKEFVKAEVKFIELKDYFPSFGQGGLKGYIYKIESKERLLEIESKYKRIRINLGDQILVLSPYFTGEDKATVYFVENGYQVIHQNEYLALVIYID